MLWEHFGGTLGTLRVLRNYLEGTLGYTLRVLWDHFGGTLETTFGGVWGHYEGDLVALQVTVDPGQSYRLYLSLVLMSNHICLLYSSFNVYIIELLLHFLPFFFFL